MRRTTAAAERNAFEKATLLVVKDLIRGTSWKIKHNTVFQQVGGFFYEASCRIHITPGLSFAEVGLKPMDLDPIVWEILGLPENRRKPLSFRAWGAFTAPAVRIAENIIEERGDTPDTCARAFLAFAGAVVQQAAKTLRNSSFTDLLRSHPYQIDRGSYAVSLVAGLIIEGQLMEAESLAAAYAADSLPSAFGLTSEGRSFHDHALAWIQSANALALAASRDV